jgi:putative RecB family exonuclease
MVCGRAHWSFSSINQYLRCPLQWFFQRVLQVPVETSASGQVLGSAVHAALASYHRSLQTYRTISSDCVVTALVDAWNERASEKPVIHREGETSEGCVAQGVALIELYLKEPPPEGIVAVEHEMIVPIHNSHGEFLENPLVAVTDLIMANSTDLIVTEFKTGSRAYSIADIQTSLQPLCYVHAATETFGKPASAEFTILVKTKSPKIQKLRAPQTHGDAGRLGDIVESVERGIRANAFYPVESPLNCSTCPFRGPCREWSRRSDSQRPISAELAVEQPACLSS